MNVDVVSINLTIGLIRIISYSIFFKERRALCHLKQCLPIPLLFKFCPILLYLASASMYGLY